MKLKPEGTFLPTDWRFWPIVGSFVAIDLLPLLAGAFWQSAFGSGSLAVGIVFGITWIERQS